MQQITTQVQTLKLQNYVDVSNQFYQNLLGYKPGQTSLQQNSESQWNGFAQQKGLNPNSSGIYLPRNQTAVIRGENPLSLFHEYFGHGLFCEQSLTGRKLVDLEQKLLGKEKQHFKGKHFILEDIQKFREKSKTFQELNKFRKQNLAMYENFAVWTEFLLSKEFGLKDIFEKKYDGFSQQEKQIDKIISFSKKYGNLATFYASGLARKTTPERVKRLLKDIYKDKLKDASFAVLYGSKKEFSDVDVFAVSDNLPKIDTPWLDVRVYRPKEFEKKMGLFDVAITDPLLTGNFIFGNKRYLEQQKERLKNQPITKEAIKYNLKETNEQRKLAYNYPENSKERKRGLSYALTSRLVAENLRQGRRILTKEDLIVYSHNENQKQLKGGKKEK